jgi:hypothetical protein
MTPVTPEYVYEGARKFNGTPHGDDANGVMDIEFPNIFDAMDWARRWRGIVDISFREPVKTLTESVVMQAKRKELRTIYCREPKCTGNGSRPADGFTTGDVHMLAVCKECADKAGRDLLLLDDRRA